MTEVDNTLGSDGPRWDADTAAASSADSPTADAQIADRESELAKGESVGRYRIVEVLGAGGMGVVYRAYDPQLDRQVALKLLRAVSSSDRAATTRMLREAQSAAKIRHANVVTVYDAGEVDGRVFIAMELMSGTDLGKWFDERRTWREVVGVMLEAAEGLRAAHAVGLIHRDFKPDNVVLEDDGTVKVLDFGLARAAYDDDTSAHVAGELADQLAETSVDRGDKLTQTGALLGTPAYMAPEQYLLEPLDARTDQFSFCVALFQGVYGDRPFSGRNYASLTLNVIDGRIEEPQDPGVAPPALLELLYRGLATNPDERFSSMDELCVELRTILKSGSSRAGVSRRKRRVGLVMSLGAVIVASSVGLTIQALREPPGPPVYEPPESEPPQPERSTRDLPVELALGLGRNRPVSGPQLWISSDTLRLPMSGGVTGGASRVDVPLVAGRITEAVTSEPYAIPPLIEALETMRPQTQVGTYDPLTLYLDRRTPFETIVRTIYSGGLAGFVRYDLAVLAEGETRVFEIKPPHHAQDTQMRRRPALELSLGHDRVQVSARAWAPNNVVAGQRIRWPLDAGAGTCELELASGSAEELAPLRRLSAALCERATVSIPVMVSADNDVAWERVAAVLSAALPSPDCLLGIMIEARSEALPNCASPVALADLPGSLGDEVPSEPVEVPSVAEPGESLRR